MTTTVRSSTKFRQADSVGPSPHTSSLQAQTCTLPPSTHGVFRRPLRRWIYSAPVNLPNTNLPTGVSGPFVFVFSSAVSNVGGSPHYLGWPTKSGPQKVARSTANRSQVRALASLAASGNSPAFSLSRYLERRHPFTTAGGAGRALRDIPIRRESRRASDRSHFIAHGWTVESFDAASMVSSPRRPIIADPPRRLAPSANTCIGQSLRNDREGCGLTRARGK